MAQLRRLAWVPLLVVIACVGTVGSPTADGAVEGLDAGAVTGDGGPLAEDAGPTDGGAPDAAEPDASVPDAGSVDAGRPDSGAFDAGPRDAGPRDAGTTPWDGGPSGPGVGVISDSEADPYHCVGRGDSATSYNWPEILASRRGVDFGPGVCQAYNHAGSGNTVTYNMAGQASGVAADWNAGKIGKVIIELGFNDFGSGNVPVSQVPTVLATYESAVNSLLGAGIPAQSILISDVIVPPGGTASAAVTAFNTGLSDMATRLGTRFVSHSRFTDALTAHATTGGYLIGGQLFTLSSGNEPHNLRLADGHLGTVGNGLLTNALWSDFLGFTPLTEAEMLSVAGL